MRSTFSSFNTAVSGLFASQRSLDTIGHNIANMNTPGYTRQRANQVSHKPTSIEGGEWLGTGVKMDHIVQIRDELLDLKYRNQNTMKGYWQEINVSLRQVEDVFGEPNGNGVAKALDAFFNSIDGVLKHSDDPTAKASFIETGIAFTRFMNETTRKFEELISDADEEVFAMTTQINTKLKQIGQLNSEIFESESNGAMANDLRDKRNILIDEISEMADIRVNKSVMKNNSGNPVEKIQIEIGGRVVVDHADVQELQFQKNQDHPLYTVSKEFNNPPSEDLKNVKVGTIRFSDGQKVDMNKMGGKIGAMIQQRDSFGDPDMGAPIRGIPFYIRTINEFVKSFANAANEIHKQGFDKNGDPGTNLFVVDGPEKNPDGTPRNIDARNIRLNPDIINSVNKLAIGQTKDESDNKNFHALYALRNREITISINQNVAGKFKTLTLGKGNPEDVIKSLITSTLGVDAKESKDAYENQVTLTIEADMNRMEVSSVSENEELTNMVKFQHAYNASARMITTIDEMIDVIVNRMGRVGL